MAAPTAPSPPPPPEPDTSDEELLVEPKEFLRPRKGGVASEPIKQGYFREPFWNKQEIWEEQLLVSLRACTVFDQFTDSQIHKFVRAMEIHLRYDGHTLVEQGESSDSLFVVLIGNMACYSGDKLVDTKKPGDIIDPVAVLWTYPRPFHLKAVGTTTVAKLCRQDYVNLCTRVNFYTRERNKQLLKGTKMLEMMEDEGVMCLVDVLTMRTYEAKVDIIRQHDVGKEFYIMNSGEVRIWVKVANDEQEYLRLRMGGLFGELALLKNAPRAASVTTVTLSEVFVLTRKQFERLFGPMANMHQQQYLTDPRKLIADFYEEGDSRGPMGSLKLNGMEKDPSLGETSWFAVYRPTSKDAIAKMLSGAAVGKGLNVKGKSAKKGVLSGFVPFMQISENAHKTLIEDSPADSRIIIYYKTKNSREEALKNLKSSIDDPKIVITTKREITFVDDFKPEAWGLEMPEPLMREVYIMRPDLTPAMGWETGRRSEPFSQDCNLHAIRGVTDPQVCLYQHDEANCMNPRGLLIAYAEKHVKPVVSDFDTFTVGSKGMEYEMLPLDQAKLITWMLDHTKTILGSLDHNPWTSRWIDILRVENERGFHPEFPKLGYGDPTSYRMIGDVVRQTAPCGAIRHGAECFNFYFPQELDDEYLCVWHGFPDKPWDYKTEEGLRQFLKDRIVEGYSFPINPVWPVRDKGWHEILELLQKVPAAAKAMQSWFPPAIKYFDTVVEMRAKFQDGFKIVQK